VPIADLVSGEDVPGPAFLMEIFAEGPERPHTASELLGELLGARGLEVEERNGGLVPVGERVGECRRALGEVLSARDGLFEFRVRAISTAAATRTPGPRVEVEPGGPAAAWLAASDAPRTAGVDRLRVRRVTGGSLQRVHLSRVESHAYVREYEADPGDPDASLRPVYGRVGHGIVLDVRAVADGDDVLLGVLVRVARLESMGDEELPFGSRATPLVVSVPLQVVRRARVLARLSEDRRLVLAGLPDPFGEPGDTLAIELVVRRIGR
jgi:hypothetical protein